MVDKPYFASRYLEGIFGHIFTYYQNHRAKNTNTNLSSDPRGSKGSEPLSKPLSAGAWSESWMVRPRTKRGRRTFMFDIDISMGTYREVKIFIHFCYRKHMEM